MVDAGTALQEAVVDVGWCDDLQVIDDYDGPDVFIGYVFADRADDSLDGDVEPTLDDGQPAAARTVRASRWQSRT